MSDSLLGDLEDKKDIVEGKNKQEDQKSDQQSERKNTSDESEKINRSYMISKSTLSKLQELKIKNPDNTFSDLVEKAIHYYYNSKS